MVIYKFLAQNIVEEMKKIIGYNINFINIEGIIIASTDKKRMGIHHEEGKKIIRSNENLIVDYDGQYKNSEEGIHVPIYFDNQIIGVIGIIGEREKVEKYGEIIQRIAEILIRDAYLQKQELFEKERKNHFIEELLFRVSKNDEDLRTRAELLNIDMDIPKIVIIARVLDCDNVKGPSSSSSDKVFNSILEFIRYDSQNLIIQTGTDIILILRAREYKSMAGVVSNIKKEAEKSYDVNIYFGIGDIANNPKGIKKSYEKAKKALAVAIAFKNKHIIHHNELDIELLIDSIPEDTIEGFYYKIFEDMDIKEVDEYMEIIEKYARHNGSITAIADEFFIHKNTLQYRLNKMKAITGYDPRVIQDMVVLYIAFIFYKLVGKD